MVDRGTRTEQQQPDRNSASLIEALDESDSALAAAREQIDYLEGLVRRAAPFVNAAAVLAEDKGPALGWLADAGASVGQRTGRIIHGDAL